MFLWCCPKKKRHKQLPEIKQSLISNEEPQTKIQENTPPKQRIFKNSQQMFGYLNNKNSPPLTSNQKPESSEQSNQHLFKSQQRHNRTNEKINLYQIGFPPSFEKSNSSKLLSPREQRQQQRPFIISKKSHLWKEQLKSDLIYYDSNGSNNIYMSYRIVKNQETQDYVNGLQYFLSKSQQKIHLLIGKYSMFSNKVGIINKYFHNIINVIIANNCKNTSNDQNLGIIDGIMVEDLKNIRLGGITSIIIMADTFHTFIQVKQYFNGIIKHLGWDQLKKSTFIFPPFMTISNISHLLFPFFKQYVSNSALDKVSLDLAFDMELIEGANLDSCITVKNRSEDIKQGFSAYDHLKLSIVFFAKQFSQLTQNIYLDFYKLTKEKTLKQYFDMKEFYKRNPFQFRSKVKEFKDIDQNIFTDLNNRPGLIQSQCQDSGYYYVIPSKIRQEIGRKFNVSQLQKKEIDTPVKKQWDDDATADDFKTVKTNKLDMVAEKQLRQIDLDLGLGDDEEYDGYYHRTRTFEEEMVMKGLELDFFSQSKSDEIDRERQYNSRINQDLKI